MQEGSDSIRKVLHDLQQPLNVIRLASGNIRARLAASLDPEEEAYLCEKLDRIDEQILRAAGQIDKLQAIIRRVD